MAQLIDHRGEPIPWPSEQELQTDESRLGYLKQHFAEHPSSGLTPSRLATILQDAERGHLVSQCELADDIEEKDAHVYSELQKRKLALLNLSGRVLPPRNASEAEKRDAEQVQELLDELPDFDDLILDMADAILKSFSNIELEWQRMGADWLVVQGHYRPQSWFQLSPDDRNQLHLRDGSYEGAALQPFGWVRHIHRARSGYPGRNGLARILAWPYLFKNYSVRDLAEFLEIYGLPLRLGKYPNGASDKEKSTLLNAVMSIGHNAGGIIPKGMEIDFKEAAKGGSDPFEAMIAWCERSQSKAILGGTLTSQADGKSSTNALGNVHNEVRQELRDSDLRQIAGTLTRDLIFPLWMLNCETAGDPRRAPRFQFDTAEPEDMAHYSQHLPGLVGMGMRIPLAWAHEKLQIPQPENDEPVLGQVQPAVPPAEPARLAALSEQDNSFKAFPDQQAIEDALDKLAAGDLDEQMLGILKPIMAQAEQGPEALRDTLDQLWPDLEDDQLQQRLAQVLFVGELWGIING
jgi:phage gp29-like protein